MKHKSQEKEKETKIGSLGNLHSSLTPSMAVTCSRWQENAALRLLLQPVLDSSSDHLSQLQVAKATLNSMPSTHQAGPQPPINTNQFEILHGQAHQQSVQHVDSSIQDGMQDFGHIQQLLHRNKTYSFRVSGEEMHRVIFDLAMRLSQCLQDLK